MKLCPNCKAQLDDHARFCLYCMTSLEEKEQIPPPVLPKRRWPWVLLLCLPVLAVLLLILRNGMGTPPETPLPQATENAVTIDTITRTVDGVRYTFRPATAADDPNAIDLSQNFVLIQVEGTPESGIYKVPAFVDEAMTARVRVVAAGAFANTHAQAIDLGHNVRFVWGDAFGGNGLTDLYLRTDVYIDEAAFAGCDTGLTIHCPSYLENGEGQLWQDLASQYGYQWEDFFA